MPTQGLHAHAGSAGVDLLLDEWERRRETAGELIPHCGHGPLLLFRRWSEGGASRLFWACAASRGRKRGGGSTEGECLAHCWDDKRRESPPHCIHPPWQEHDDHGHIHGVPPTELAYCTVCNSSFRRGPTPTKVGPHKGHKVFHCHKVARPTEILWPLAVDTKNAQYFFSRQAVEWTVEQLARMATTRVVCLGTPRLHETLRADGRFSSLLLDLDARFAWFHAAGFARFNMGNGHFFDGVEGEPSSEVAEFLASATAVVVDPPFGLHPAALGRTLRLLWQRAVPPPEELPTLLFFPYFLEKGVAAALPSLSVSDYEVSYDNHPTYHGRQRTRGSPVRVYSNVPDTQLVLPAAEGYTFCTPCARYVAPTNKHCDKCGCCPSRDGRRWVHCERCRTCVKPGRIHCDVCKRCQPPGHDCDALPLSSGRCHVCGSTEHKRIWHDSHDMHDRHGISVPCEKSTAAPEKKRRVATATEEWDVAIVPHR